MKREIRRLAVGMIAILLICLGVPPSHSSGRDETVDSDQEVTRRAAVAGMFYPAEVETLNRVAQESLESATKIELKQPVKILMAPHAGYTFCAQGLAAAYKQIQGAAFQYDRVILIGPSHRFATKAAALCSATTWQTPLGPVAVDMDLCKRFTAASDRIEFDDRAHVTEHCLEVQLPYLIAASGGKTFKIVPILTNSRDPMDHKTVARALVEFAADPGTLIVISTDLSHYPPANIAEKVDKAILEAVKSLSPETVAQENAKLMKVGHSGLSCTMCGLEAALCVLHAAKGLGINHAELVSYTHSGMSGGDRSGVVGYGAMVFTTSGKSASAEESVSMKVEFSPQTKRDLIEMVREAARKVVSGDLVDFKPSDNPEVQIKAGCFVTFKNKGRLRGCIGQFTSDEPLWKTVRDVAIASATRDSRFFSNPITHEEIAHLEVEISILSPLQRVSDPLKQIKLGEHGIVIRDKERSGTFLPQVASETGWTLEEFLGHCARDKAGLGWDGWKSPTAGVYTYTATIIEEGK